MDANSFTVYIRFSTHIDAMMQQAVIINICIISDIISHKGCMDAESFAVYIGFSAHMDVMMQQAIIISISISIIMDISHKDFHGCFIHC